MESLGTLDELVERVDDEKDLYIRWSAGPDADRSGRSRDELTGIELPGLSASALTVESWWNDRPLRLWVARRLYDYRHLADRRPDARPWVFVGRECGRGPDNEPLAECLRAVAWVAPDMVDEASRLIEQQPADWGPLDRGEDAAARS
jgi:hypothetical protein